MNKPDRHVIKINVGGDGYGSVQVDGEEVAGHTAAVVIKIQPGEPNEVHLKLVATDLEIEIDDLELFEVKG